jgi:NAD(P)-dependent dehydrogenase (short-subunit alcohol dehydrogenase family)
LTSAGDEGPRKHPVAPDPAGTAPRLRLDGRLALVTGAARGIGAAIARRLADEGATVVVTDLDAQGAALVVAGIEAEGGRAVAMGMDVTEASARRAATDAAAGMGGIDILVNNAGVFDAAPPLEVVPGSWQRIFSVNTEATFFCAQAAIPSMREKGRGRIINLASTAARIGNPTMLAYNASKAAVLAITRGLALEYGRDGITVNAVLPGIVATPMWEALESDVAPLLGFAPGTLMRDRVSRIPLGRAGAPEDVAAMVAFLASDDAAYVTGQSLHVCGGLSMP